MHALLVEDSKAISDNIRLMLEYEGISIDVVDTGESGAAKGQAGVPPV